jgi:hypothetical protein
VSYRFVDSFQVAGSGCSILILLLEVLEEEEEEEEREDDGSNDDSSGVGGTVGEWELSSDCRVHRNFALVVLGAECLCVMVCILFVRGCVKKFPDWSYGLECIYLI